MSLLGRDEIHGDVRAYILGVHGRHVQSVLVLRPFGTKGRRDHGSQDEDQRTGRIRKVCHISSVLPIQNNSAAVIVPVIGNLYSATMGEDLGGTEGTVPKNLRWEDGPCIRPPNIWRSNFEVIKKDDTKEFLFEIEVFRQEKGHIGPTVYIGLSDSRDRQKYRQKMVDA